MGERSSAFSKHPNYRVDLEQGPRRVRVVFNGETIADSGKALVVHETAHEPIYYFPRDDVRLDLLERTEHHTFCPFKGEASYWTVRAGGGVAENAIWSYEDPFEEVAGLANYMSFYADQLEHRLDSET